MNIHGIGTDIVNIKRIKRLLKIKNSTFKKKIFTNIEIKTCEKRKNVAECYAKDLQQKRLFLKP